MAVIQSVITLIVLGFFYSRMVRRESPGTITKTQAVIPVILGVVSAALSFLLFLAIGLALKKTGFSSHHLSDVVRSVFLSFITAGLPEEITKFLMMLLALLVFRTRIRNVYEYILIGAAVGFGFTLVEEFFYGSNSGLTAFTRLITIATHMVFGVIMARHLGKAKYNRVKGSGSVTGEYVLALLVPILLHTLYDAGTATNVYLNSKDEDEVLIGIAVGLVFTVILFVIQIVVLVRLKKNTGKYCAMTIISPDEQDAQIPV